MLEHRVLIITYLARSGHWICFAKVSFWAYLMWFWTKDDSATDRDQHNSNAANWYVKLSLVTSKSKSMVCAFLNGILWNRTISSQSLLRVIFFLQFRTDRALTFTALQTLSKIFQLIRQQFMSGYHSQKQMWIGKSKKLMIVNHCILFHRGLGA